MFCDICRVTKCQKDVDVSLNIYIIKTAKSPVLKPNGEARKKKERPEPGVEKLDYREGPAPKIILSTMKLNRTICHLSQVF